MKRKWTGIHGVLSLELEITFRSSGYYDSGQSYGPPERCYPPEGDDERVLDSIIIGNKTLPKELAEQLFEFLLPEVMEVKIDA